MERKLLLLGLLRRQELYGYQINEIIDSRLGFSAFLKKATAYRLLHQMAEEGWIVYREEQKGNRPSRRVYAITQEGEDAFQSLLRQSLASYQPTQLPHAISIAFLDALPPEEAIPLLERRRDEISRMLQSFVQSDQPDGGYQLVLEHRILHLASEFDWLKEIISLIASPGWTKSTNN